MAPFTARACSSASSALTSLDGGATRGYAGIPQLDRAVAVRLWLSPSTLKVYVAAITAHHDAVNGWSLGKHHLIVGILVGARRLNPPKSPLVPSWDLSIVLAGLQRGLFELLDSVKLKFLSAETVLLTALTYIKRVRDLQAFSKSTLCSGRPTLTLSWDPSLDTWLRFPPCPSVIRWWTCKHCPRRSQIQPWHCCVP